jgi:hypothetical protein
MDSHLCHTLFKRYINWHEPFVPHIFSLDRHKLCCVYFFFAIATFTNCVAFLWFRSIRIAVDHFVFHSFISFRRVSEYYLVGQPPHTHTLNTHSFLTHHRVYFLPFLCMAFPPATIFALGLSIRVVPPYDRGLVSTTYTIRRSRDFIRLYFLDILFFLRFGFNLCNWLKFSVRF